jgi:hypothetical protein
MKKEQIYVSGDFSSICKANGVYWNPPEPFCVYHNCFTESLK